MKPIRFFFLLIVKTTNIIIKPLYNVTDNYLHYIYLSIHLPSHICHKYMFIT